jgi:hypothetical protein
MATGAGKADFKAEAGGRVDDKAGRADLWSGLAAWPAWAASKGASISVKGRPYTHFELENKCITTV